MRKEKESENARRENAGHSCVTRTRATWVYVDLSSERSSPFNSCRSRMQIQSDLVGSDD